MALMAGTDSVHDAGIGAELEGALSRLEDCCLIMMQQSRCARACVHVCACVCMCVRVRARMG
jgi:hypothetical protein